MEYWRDQGIVLSARAHGENGAVVSLLTEGCGRHAGYVHGGQGSAKRAMLQPGVSVGAEWSSRLSENMGTYKLEQDGAPDAGILLDPLKLGALMSACALCDSALPERESHPALFYGLQALIAALDGEHWAPAYVMWEIAFLKELGFALDLTRCAGGGDPATLTHVSPKSGRAVSAAQAAPYKEKLLDLPHFLRPSGGGGEGEDILTGLKMTGYFLEHWAFNHHTKGVPEPRLRFQERFEKSLGPKDICS